MSDASPDRPRMEISEPAGLRAMAHPARLAALEHLRLVGPATATELGAAVGLSASAMSYHLRNLERAGMAETAPSRGDGRERVWRSTFTGYTVERLDDGTAEMRRASRELMESILMIQEARTRQWLARADVPGWLDTGHFTEALLWVTDDEMRAIGQQIDELLRPYTRLRRTEAPPGARFMNLVTRAIPSDLPLPGADAKE